MEQTVIKTHCTEADADIILCTALDIGEHLLRNGSEISRVENTIERICTALGATHVEAFVIPSLIAASVRMSDGGYSEQMRHVKKGISMNLNRVEQLNTISRELCSGAITVEEARHKVERVKKVEPYRPLVCHVGAAIFVAGFTLFFGGTWLDALGGGLIAVVVSILSGFDVPFTKGLMKPFTLSFVAGSLSVIVCFVGLGNNVDAVAIGTIMQVIPGLSFWTGVMDMVNGNLISGSLRLLQALLTAVMIALGYAMAFLVFGGLM